MSRLDDIEAIANAAIGLVVSTIAVWVLRHLGWWETSPAWAMSALFFALSVSRARILRAMFRRMA